MADAPSTPRERLTRAAVLVFSGSIAALLVVQAGVPGCGGASAPNTTASPEPARGAAPNAPEADPPAPAAPSDLAEPAAPAPAADTAPNPAPNAPPNPAPNAAGVAPPAKATPGKATPGKADVAEPPPFLPASKSGMVFRPPPQQQAGASEQGL